VGNPVVKDEGKRSVESAPSPHGEKGAVAAPVLSCRLALRAGEMAAALGVSIATLRRMTPEIPHYHVGNVLLFPVRPFERWQEERATEEGAATDRAVRDVLEYLE